MIKSYFNLPKYRATIFLVLALLVLYVISRYNYLLFHSLADGVSIVIAAFVFVIIWNGRRIVDNDYFLYVGIAFLFFALWDFLHLLGNKNMGVFPEYGNLGPALYIVSRYLLSISLLMAPLFINRKLNTTLMFAVYLLVTLLLLLSIFYWHIFPVCIVEGVGLTPFKVLSDYIICLILLGAIGLLFINRRSFNSRVLWLIVSSIILSIATGLAFTLYADPFGIMNAIGHFFQIASFYLTYLAFIETSLTKPQDILYQKLKKNEENLAENVDQLNNANAVLEQEVAERKHLEKNISKMQNILAEGQKIAHMGTFEYDAENKATAWSEEEYRIYGFDPAEPSPAYEDMLAKCIYPEDSDLLHQVFTNAMRNQSIYELEHRILRPDGSVRWVRDRAHPYVDNDGKLLRYVGVTLDITERKQAEDALRENEEKHRRLFETMIQGVVYQASDGRILSANPAAERILGLSLDQMLGKTSLDPGWRSIRENGSVLPGEEHPAMVALRTGKLVERFIMGVINPQKNKYAMISVTATPLFQPGETLPFQVYATFDDITAYRQAEENYRSLFSEMLDGFALHEIICNDEGIPIDYRFLAVNPTFERMTGLKADDITGKTVIAVMPATERYWIETYGRVALTGEPAYFQNYSAELQKHFEVTAFRPAPNQFACIFADITARKQAEEKIKASLQEKELLLKEIHHRVKNNLQIISSLLSLQAKSIEDEKLEGIFRECQDRIAAMASVHQLLYRSQNFAEINFGDYLRETASQLFRSYKTDKSAISLVIQAENVMLPIDTAIPCGLIINELVTNALKYAFPGASKGEIRIEMSQTQQGISLFFADNGIGFPKDVDFSSSGTLGLKLIHLLVKQLDGSIEQFINGGTRYAILLKPEKPRQEEMSYAEP